LPQTTASADALGGDAQRFVTGQDLPLVAIVPPSETAILNPVGFRALGYEKAYCN